MYLLRIIGTGLLSRVAASGLMVCNLMTQGAPGCDDESPPRPA